jgi:Lrp/AsnC family transcriptional regulator for asnA, asnC and gidA
MIGIRVDGDAAVATPSRRCPRVDYLVSTAGSFDILAEVVCEDDDHLLDLINRRSAAIPASRAPRPSST